MKVLSNKALSANSIDWPVMMQRALDLAGNVISAMPNPRVGCVIVNADSIVGEGWHAAAGQAHAEVMALNDAGEKARTASAFISLEPCSHSGRTGPCCAALIAAGIKRVVFATIDPNPVVAGRGVELLEAAGVEVLHLIDFEKSARAINPGYFKRRENGLPFVRCKLAMSLDGRTALANGVSKWITSATARADGQFLRARSSAIVTGVTTVLRDNPSLNLRSDELDISSSQRERNAIGFSRQPLRVILDSKLRTPASARILQQAGAVKIYTTVAAASVAIGRNPAVNVEIRTVASDGQRVNLRTVLESLASDFECNEILVEAGSTLSTAFIKAGMVDELIIYIAPKFLGSDAQSLLEFSGLKSMTESLNFEIIDLSKVGGDIRVTLVPQNSTGE